MQIATVDILLSNATDRLLEQLKKSIKTQLHKSSMNIAFEEKEKALHAAFVEAELKAVEEVLSQCDVNVPVINLEGKTYRQVLRSEKTYMSAAGPVRIKRSLYRAKGEAYTMCPLERTAGIIEDLWTPRAAKQALFAVSQLTPYETEALFKELGAMNPSRASLDRLPKKIGAKWESHRDIFESSLREKCDIPEEATTIGGVDLILTIFSLDV